ncbi:MAG: hypothetical protein CM1200mP22_07570 [Dehalococcoidia bacterium]|nr:MAG: hypothetical protein CM1200mP22_07570 [Dehalococcoidia bacterium]
MSFVGIRGLGFEIQLSLHDLKFAEVWTLLLFLFGLVLWLIIGVPACVGA